MEKVKKKDETLSKGNSYSRETFIAAKEAAAKLRVLLKGQNLKGIFSVQEGIYHGGFEIHVTFFSERDLLQNNNSIPEVFEGFYVRRHAPFYGLDEFYPKEFSKVNHPKILNFFGLYTKKRKLKKLIDANENKWASLSKEEAMTLIKKHIHYDMPEIYFFDVNNIESYLE